MCKNVTFIVRQSWLASWRSCRSSRTVTVDHELLNVVHLAKREQEALNMWSMPCPFLITNTSNVSHKYSTLEIKWININEFETPGAPDWELLVSITQAWNISALKELSLLLFLYIFPFTAVAGWSTDIGCHVHISNSWVSKIFGGQTQNTLGFLLSPLISPADLATNPERRTLSGNHSALISDVVLLSSDLVSCCSQRDTELLRLKCVSVCVHMCISVLCMCPSN